MKFTIRDLLLVTAIVALAAGWWVDRQAREARIKLLEKALSDVALYGSPVDWPGATVTITTTVMPPELPQTIKLPSGAAPAPNPAKD